MRAVLAVVLLLALPTSARADLGDVDTSLTEVSFEEVQISPDGRRLAFITRANDFERDREVLAVWTLDLSGSTRPARLVDTGTFTGLRWSPDGNVLSFLSATDDEAAQLFVLEPAAGKIPRRLTDPVRFADGVDAYDWLPDGSDLIFVAFEPNRETAEARQKWRELYGDVRRLAGPPAKPSFYRITLAEGRAERLIEAPSELISALDVSPDGWWLAAAGYGAAETASSAELFLLPLGPQAIGPQRTQNSIWEESFAWAGKDLFVVGPGEETGRYTNTEGRLYRLEGLRPAHPRQPGTGRLRQASGSAG